MTDVLFVETSSLTGENVQQPFILLARSILLSIETGVLDPEQAGTGVSYGERALRRVSSWGSSSILRGSSLGKKRLFRSGKCC
jgi:Ras-related protein Rab-4B